MRPPVFLFCFLLVSLCRSSATELADLSFIVSTTFGEPLEDAHLSLTSIGPVSKLMKASDVKGEARFARVPFGLYEVEILLPGFVPRRERIAVYGAQVVYRLGLALGYRHSTERTEIVGTVSPVSRTGPERWVRLLPLFGSDLIENSVARSGEFQLVGMAPGKYLLVVLEGGRVLSTEPIEVQQGSRTMHVRLDK